MNNQPLTYEILLSIQLQKIQSNQINKQTAANRATALRLFLRVNLLAEEDSIGLEMRSEFSLSVEKVSNHLLAENRSSRSITNTISMLRRFREAVAAEDKVRAIAADASSPFLQAVRSLMEGLAVKRVAKQAYISHDILAGWLKGKTPRVSSIQSIHRLESFFGVEKGALALMAGIFGDKRSEKKVGVAAPNEFRDRQKLLVKTTLFLVPPIDSPLRKQWEALLRYKVASIPTLERSNMGRWTIAPLPMYEQTKSVWYNHLEGNEIPSAHATWSQVAGYLGWMALPAADGGIGIPAEELQTLAWLTVPDHIERYIEWRKKRSGGIVSGSTPVFFGILAWMTNPEYGYLTQQSQMQSTLPTQYRDEKWLDLCARQFRLCARLGDIYRQEVRPSRDPFQPIRPILDLQQPMDGVADMIQRMRADRPIGGSPSMEAIWGRDLLIIKLLVSNPLRIRNIASLRWSPKNKDGFHPQSECSLYQRSDGSWRIFVPKQLLKNRRGKSTMDYDSPVLEMVWKDLERYLFRYRPVLMSSPTDLVLLTRKKDKSAAHKPFSEISQTVKVLTKKYLLKCPGVGAHAFRHIVATSIIKSPSGTTKIAALMLNDKETTVDKHYSGLRTEDGSERMQELLASSLKKM